MDGDDRQSNLAQPHLPKTTVESMDQIKEFALRIFAQEIAQKQLYYHTYEHVQNVQRRSSLIFQAISSTSEQVFNNRSRQLLEMCAIAHDMLQVFNQKTSDHAIRKREPGVSETATIDRLLRYIHALNQQLEPNSPARLTDDDIDVIRAAIANGDLTQSIEPTRDQTEVGQLLRAFQDMVKSLNGLITQAQRSGIQISTSTTQIAAAGRQLEATVNEQVASMHEVNATSRQIATTAGDLAKAMDEVTDTAQSTTSSATASQVNLDKIQAAMQNLVQAPNSIASKLRVMDEKANNINNVVTTITKVADQTNLLSLNAAIEAEKAGEYGAGFAVVAREIRRLADQSAVATLEIEQMVKAMQSSVSTGVIEMDRFSREVAQYVEEVGNISQEIDSFIQDVQGLLPRFGTVSQRMDEQYQGAEQISTAIAQLSDASLQTMQSLQETNTALTQLDDAAQGLQHEISQFKV
jgi:methyl-accepting chemotaxis protein WspA